MCDGGFVRQASRRGRKTTMQPFVYTALPARVLFGSGTLACLGRELDALGCSRALVLSTPFQKPLANEVSHQLGAQLVCSRKQKCTRRLRLPNGQFAVQRLWVLIPSCL